MVGSRPPAGGTSEGRRRLAGWGFEGVEVPAKPAMHRWLEARLGASEPTAVVQPELARLPTPRVLPPLPVPISGDPLDRLAHARGQGLPDLFWLRAGVAPALPDGVARPAADEVGPLLAACAANGVRVVPRGGGTSVTGGVNVLAGDAPVVVLDLERVHGLLDLDPVSRLATFAAGTTGPGVEAALAPHGLTLGHLPQSWELSTVGGWVVTRSAGQESLGHGRIEDLVAGLEVATPTTAWSLPARPASAAGPDLRQLVMGSEGRLGVLTQATLRVHPRPQATAVRAWLLPDWETGLAAARALVQNGVALSMLRLSDPTETAVALTIGLGGGATAGAARRYLAWRGVGHGCLLLLGAAGDARSVRQTFAAARAQLAGRGAVPLGAGPGRRWLADRFRHPYLRDALLDVGYATETLETAATWSRIAAVREGVAAALGGSLQADGEAVEVLCHVSHPYADGASLYFTSFFRVSGDPAAAVARWACLKRAANDALVALGATLSHHHGVGSWHAPWLGREVGGIGMRALAAAAAAVDPTGVLNPHVLLDPVDRLTS